MYFHEIYLGSCTTETIFYSGDGSVFSSGLSFGFSLARRHSVSAKDDKYNLVS